MGNTHKKAKASTTYVMDPNNKTKELEMNNNAIVNNILNGNVKNTNGHVKHKNSDWHSNTSQNTISSYVSKRSGRSRCGGYGPH